MILIVPIFLFATVMGLTARRITPVHWIAFALWIGAVMGVAFLKH